MHEQVKRWAEAMTQAVGREFKAELWCPEWKPGPGTRETLMMGIGQKRVVQVVFHVEWLDDADLKAMEAQIRADLAAQLG